MKIGSDSENEYHITKGPYKLDFCVVYRYMGKTKNGEQKEQESTLSYHPNIQQAIDSLLKQKIIDSIDEDIKTLLNRIEQIKSELKENIKEICFE